MTRRGSTSPRRPTTTPRRAGPRRRSSRWWRRTRRWGTAKRPRRPARGCAACSRRAKRRARSWRRRPPPRTPRRRPRRNAGERGGGDRGRLGGFGGPFDPPHLGHLVAASDAAGALGLDRVLWVPSAQHPLKRDRVRTPAQVRLEMVRAAIAGDPRFAAEELELRRAGPSYTVDTLRELRERT